MKKLFKKVIPILLTLIMILSFSIPVVSAAEKAKKETFYVTASTLSIRKGAGTKYKVVGKYKKNTKVTVVKTKKGWCKTSKGWVNKKYLSKKKPSKKKTYRRTVRGIKVTAYCAGPCCNGYYSSGNSSITASGMRIYNNSSYANKYCAATPSVGALGETIQLKLNGKIYNLKIVDRLGSSYGNRVDFFIPNHSQCNRFGVRYNVTGKIYK